MKKILLYLGVIIVILIVSFYFLNNPKVKLINSEEFDKLKQDENVFVLNTHTPYEGEIEGTDLIIEDWENIKIYENKLPKDKNIKILVYCRTGRMADSAAEQLLDLGYKNVYNLEGGMKAWEVSGRELIFNKH